MSWLRLQTCLECIPHPCHMYTKCFSNLICHEWAYALPLLYLCRSGVEFRKIGVGQRLSDVVISWLRLQTCLECIPHPCHMYTKCFSTMICCGWAHESTLTLLCLGRSGVDFRKIELSPSPSDVVMSWLRLQTCLECIPHPCHKYTKCFINLICHGWAYGCTLTLLRLWRSGVFWKIGMAELEWCCNVMVEAANPHEVHLTSISNVYKAFHHLDMLWMGTWVYPYTVTPGQVRGGF